MTHYRTADTLTDTECATLKEAAMTRMRFGPPQPRSEHVEAMQAQSRDQLRAIPDRGAAAFILAALEDAAPEDDHGMGDVAEELGLLVDAERATAQLASEIQEATERTGKALGEAVLVDPSFTGFGRTPEFASENAKETIPKGKRQVPRFDRSKRADKPDPDDPPDTLPGAG